MASFSVRRLLLLLPILSLFASCSEDFQVGAPYKSITVVYGILDVNDSAHYIRIQKAYYDENTSALLLAKNPDSNLYPNLEVHLREVSDTTKSATIIFDETLSSVDLNKEAAAYTKDSAGTFFSAPNRAYKSTRVLNPDHAYRVVLTNPVTGEKDSAVTSIIPSSGGKFQIYDFVFNFALDFQHPSSQQAKFGISFTAPPNAQFFEGVIRFHY